MYADSAADFTLALALTVLFGLLTYLAWRRRGLGALVTGIGITLLPFALWLTRTLSLLSAVVDDVGNWATGLVFSPRVWVGLIVAAVAVVLIVAGLGLGRRADRSVTAGGSTARLDRTSPTQPAGAAATRARKRGGSGDPELDEIEAMLRRRGIS